MTKMAPNALTQMENQIAKKNSIKYKITKHTIKALTFWIFPHALRRQAQRNLRYWFGIGLKPESMWNRYQYNKIQKTYIANFAQTDIFSYHIVSLGCDCLSRTIPTLWGIKPRKKQGELSLPFDLSINSLEGIVKNLKEDFANYFNGLQFNGIHWTIPQSKTSFVHEYDCNKDDIEKIKERFSRRINNLRNIFSSPKPIIFVNHHISTTKTPQEIAELYNELYNILQKKRQGKPFKLLIVDTKDIIFQKNLLPQIETYSVNYLPEDYIWYFTGHKMTPNGILFEKGLIKTIEKLIQEIK